MANDLNRHECIGRLGQDPEIKFLPSGEAVTNISIACGESWTDKTNGQKQERVTWVPYVAFGKLAEIMGEYLRKGSKVYVSGKLRVRKWQDKQGEDRYSTEIVCDQMQMLDSKPQDGSQEQRQQQRPAAPAPHQAPHSPPAGFIDDDLPFMRLHYLG
jgi:single-strand DNA-binding protein